MKGKRLMSCVLTGALALVPVSGLSYADEMPAVAENPTENVSGDQNDEVPETQVPQTDTEAPSYRLILSDQDVYHLTWDRNHFKETAKDGETTLLYKAGEVVNLDIETEPGYQIDKVIFADTDDIVRDPIHAEVPFEWKDEDTLTFTMPGNDVWMHTEYHLLSSETAGTLAVQNDTGEALTDASQVGFASSGTQTSETAAQESSASETDGAQNPAEPGSNEQSPGVGQTDPGRSSDGTAEVQSGGGNEDSASVIESDGFPAQGSVMMLSEIGLASDLTDLPEDKFEDVTYPKDTVQTSLAQNDVKFGTPGIYTVVYRADETTTGKFWFLVRPVRIVENRKEPETQAEGSGEKKSGTEQQTDETESSDDDADADPAALSETEQDILSEAETEAETEAVEYPLVVPDSSSYSISVEGDRTEYKPGEEVVATVVPQGDLAISTASAMAVDADADASEKEILSEENKSGDGQGVYLDYDDSASAEEAPDGSGEELAGVPATVSFAMPKAPVVLRAAAVKKTTVRYRGYISSNAHGPHDLFQGASIRLTNGKGVWRGRTIHASRCTSGHAYMNPQVGQYGTAVITYSVELTSAGKAKYSYSFNWHNDNAASWQNLAGGGSFTTKVPSKGIYLIKMDTTTGTWMAGMAGVAYRVYSTKASADAANKIYAAGGPKTTKQKTAVKKDLVERIVLQKASQKLTKDYADKTSYYVIEELPPAGWLRDNTVTKFTFSVEETEEVELYEQPVGFPAYLTLKKSIVLDGQKYYTNISDHIRIDGALFNVYLDPGCTVMAANASGVPAQLITDANGNTSPAEVFLTGPATVYVKEVASPEGTEINPNVFPVALTETNTAAAPATPGQDVEDSIIPVPVKVKKSSSNTVVTKDNRMYSLANAEFTLTYTGAAGDPLNGKSYTLHVNENGDSETVNVAPGNYQISETAAPKGYKTVDPFSQGIFPSTGGVQELPITDEPLTGTLNSLVNKIVDPMYKTNRSTAGTQLTVNYYDSPEPEEAAKQTWVIQTIRDADGNYTAALDKEHLVSGDLTYGENVLPLGCITVQETKAPEGYELNDTVWKLQIQQSGNGVMYSSTSQPEFQNAPVNPEDLKDKPSFGDLKLGKISEEQGKTPDGDAAFKGAVFEVINANDFDVVLHTAPDKPVHPGEVATTITTGDDGIGQTAGSLLQTGNYTVREQTPPEGYTLSDKVLSVTVNREALADYSETDPYENIPQRAGFKVRKKDLELAEKLCTLTDKTGAEFHADRTTPDGNGIQGEASLEGAEFDLINRSLHPVVVGGRVYQPGDKIRSFTTDENGEFTSPASKDVLGNDLPPERYLPYGTYELKETKAPEGYNLRGKFISTEFSVRSESEGTMMDLNSVSAEDDVIRFDVDIHKVEAELNEEDPHEKLEPMEGIQFDIYRDQDMDGESPKDGVKPYASIYTNKEGYATTKDAAYPHGRLPYGHYTIIENKDTVPAGFGTVHNLHVNGTADGGVYDGQLIQAGIYQDQHGEWIQLAKIDQDSRKPVLRAGAEIQILREDKKTAVELKDSTNHKKVSTFITNEEGMAYLPQRLETGTYYLKELKAPYGYVLNKDLVEFKVDTANSWDQLITWQMKDKEVKGVLKITKYDAETKKKIAGAKFGVYADEKIVSGDGTVQAEKGDLVDTVVIGSDGTGTSGELYLGKYHAAEIEAPEGYTLDPSEIPFELTYQDQNTPVITVEKEASNKPTRLNLLKFEQPVDQDGEWSDAEPTKRLQGITFTFTRIGGGEPDRSRAGEVFSGGSIVTDEGGNILIKYIESGIYSVQETATIPGYVLDDTVTYFTVDDDGYIFLSDAKGTMLDGQEKGDTAEIRRKDQYTRWDFSKVDMTGQELKGAVMQIFDAEGNIASYMDDNGKGILATWVSDGTPHRICRLPVGNYVLHEKQSIKGYTLATDIPFEVTNTGVLCRAVMTNKKLIVNKLDVLGDGVKKAGLEIYEVHFHEDGTKYLSEDPVEAWKSDGKQYDTSNLQVGHTYRLIESKVPKGYVEAGPIDFTITDDLTDQTVTMMDKKVLVSKVNTKITMIAGAKVEVRNSEGQVVDAWTSDGTAYPVSGLKAGQTYTLVETEAPEGYVLADPIEFTVTKNWFADDSFSLTNTQVFMSKADVTGENEIPGATLKVTDKDTGKEVDRWVSGEEPHVISGLHVGGSYTLHEEIAAEGYVRASDVDFTVDDGFTVRTVKMVDKQVTMTKTDVTGEKEVPGAKLTVTDKETGKVADSWTSGDKPHAISGLEVGKTYILKEVTAPDGYAVAEQVEFEVPDDGQNQTVSMKDKKITIEKLDVLGQPVRGAKLAVYELTEDAEEKPAEETQQNAVSQPETQTETETGIEASTTAPENGAEVAAEEADKTQVAEETGAAAQIGAVESDQTAESGTAGQNSETERQGSADTSQNAETVTTGTVGAMLGRLVDTWVSDGTPHAVSGLIVGHSYRLVEESAPAGYAAANPRDFTVTQEDADQNIAMVDRQVLISKVDTEITMIAGAHLQVTDQNGKIVDNWVSDGTAHAVSGLAVGQTYTLTETEAPAGYVLAAPITFTVSDQPDANDQLNLVNKQVKITKTDITGEKEVVGAHLSVVEKDSGRTADTWTSEKEPHPVSGLEVGKTYILTETKPADGYVTAESIEFTIEDNGKSEMHQMKDDVTKLKISKQDITRGEELPGAQLVIKDSEGKEIEKWTSTNEPHYIEMLPVGSYTLTETAPPALYMKAEDVQFEVKDTGEIQTVTMFDRPTPIIIHKKDIVKGKDGEELPGAELTVTDENGKTVDSWISGSTPHEIQMLPAGQYTLTEVTAPNGYEVAESVVFNVTDNGQVMEVTMYDSPKDEKIDLTGKKDTRTSTPSYGGGGTPGTYVTSPVKTGDNAPVLQFVLLAVLALGTALTLIFTKKKGEKR